MEVEGRYDIVGLWVAARKRSGFVLRVQTEAPIGAKMTKTARWPDHNLSFGELPPKSRRVSTVRQVSNDACISIKALKEIPYISGIHPENLLSPAPSVLAD